MMDKIESRTVVITGGSSGIGLGLLKRFSDDGWNVAALSRRVDFWGEPRLAMSVSAGKILAIHCDVSKRSQVHDAISKCYETFGKIDLVIANAGISLSAPASEMNAEIFEKSLAVNVLGAVYLFEAVIPKMKEQGHGHLVGISSLAAYRGLPEAGAYSASKAALSALMESMRLDLAPLGISVSIIHPGFIKTPLTDRNQYRMPFLMTLDAGVDKIYRAIKAKKSNIAFPFPLSTVAKSLQFWPDKLYQKAMFGRRNAKAEK